MLIEKKYNIAKKRIKKQTKEIEDLSRRIYELEIDNKEKQDLINYINSMRENLKDSLDIISKQRNEYQKLILELKEMKKIMNVAVFKGRWKLIKLLMR